MRPERRQKRIKNFDFRMDPTIRTLFPHMLRGIAMHSVCRCSLPVFGFLKKGTPVIYLSPSLDLGGSGLKHQHL